MNKYTALFLAAHLGCCIIFAFGESDCIPVGYFATADMQQVAYVLHIVCILQTLAAALVAYHLTRRPILQLLLLPLVLIIDIAVYYLTLSSTGLLCAAIAYLILWYCYATAQRHHR